jgi:hypothetical protein
MHDEQDPVCRDEQQRRADVLAHPTLNGIDYVEVDAADHRLLRVFFLKPVPPAAFGLPGNLAAISIAGGVRVVGIQPVSVVRQADGHLDLTVSEGGDYSLYTLTIDVPELDLVLHRVDVSFMASCPVDFDCRQEPYCPPPATVEPVLDYLAKDYSSLRRLLLDLLPRLNPAWVERNPSDLGIALVELLAYAGDHLSYFQDAVANEAYLETLRQRVSARRHARLVDYRIHEGRNAWTWVHLQVDAPGALPLGSKLVTRLFAPLAGTASPPGVVLEAHRVTAATLAADPALTSAVVFETAHDAAFDPRHNEIRIHAWGNEECCLRPGTREAHLYTLPPGTSVAVRPVLARGECLLLEEVKGPRTGARADADPLHRQVVRIEEDPEPTEDPVYQETLAAGVLQRRLGAEPPLPLLRVRWRREDALAFPLCLSARRSPTEMVREVSVARGNLVLADHGVTVENEEVPLAAPVAGDTPFRLALSRAPLTFECEPDRVDYDPASGRLTTPRTDLGCDLRAARPAVAVRPAFPTGDELWTPVTDLLDSPTSARHFVAEVDDQGGAWLRFGDGEYGREVSGATAFHVTYRVGNGAAGNVGAEALAHAALPGPAGWIRALRNPLAARGGTAPETLEEVRRRAPQAFRAEQYRAVTEADYVAAARKLPEVAGAVASFRWTGSWYTVFVGVDPRDPEDLVRRPKGLALLAPRLERRVRAFLTRYRLAGYDLEIRPPRFVPVELELDLCVDGDHFRADVAHAVTQALSNRVLADGSRGFFHPDHFTFGDAVYLSRLYAAVERVAGVESLVVRVFQRADGVDNGELETGVLPVGPWEIAQLDNDPSFMENGVLRVNARGGKA